MGYQLKAVIHKDKMLAQAERDKNSKLMLEDLTEGSDLELKASN